MNSAQIFRTFGPVDARMVWRDSLLRSSLFLPVVMGLAMRVVVPPFVETISRLIGFDLQPYAPMTLTYLMLMMMPSFAGMLVGMLLLDQRDDRTLTALQVTPLSLKGYLMYRLAVPTLLGFVMTLIAVPLSGLMTFSVGALLAAALLAAPLAPVFALVFAGLAANKVQGLAVMKTVGGIVELPIIGFFLPERWQPLFGVIPTYWPAKVFTLLQNGEAGAWLYALVGVAYQILLIWLLARRFHHQMTH